MAVRFLTTKYNKTLGSLTAITYVIASNGTMTAYVPFSATSFNADNTVVNVDSYGAQWCNVYGVQQYGLNEHIYLLILKFDKFYVYDEIQGDSRSAIISGTFATKNKNMSFLFEFKITQIACLAKAGQLTGDIVFWKLEGSPDVLYRIENTDRWRGINYGTRVIRSTNIVESKMKVSHCINLSGFYSGQEKLTTFTTENCNFSGVTTFSSMFYNCKLLNSIDISDWDFSSASTIEAMFSSCQSLTSVTFPNNSLSSCTNMSSLFLNCASMESVDMSGVNTKNVTTMANMFSNCGSIQSLDVSGFNVTNCTNMANMFNGCTSLGTLDLTSWDVSNCVNFTGMFNRCQSLTSIIGDVSDICGATVLNGAKKSIDISTTNLNLPSIVAIFLGIDNVEENSNIYIKLNRRQAEDARDYLSIAQAKNWIITVSR